MHYRDSYQGTPEICVVPTRTRVHMLNGVTSELLLTCSYSEDGVLTPIHLTVEGYGAPVVAFQPVVAGLSGVATIDAVDDSLVHVVFTAECPSAVDSDIETEVSVLVTRGAGPTERTDCLLRGAIEIEDAPLPAA